MTKSIWFYKLRAWSVHLYTSLGIITGFFALGALTDNNPYLVFLFLGIACFIDSTDGALARAWEVKKYAASVDGRKLDDIVDFLNYTFIPVFFIYYFKLVSGPWLYSLIIVLILSIYGFCRDVAKTDDGFFTGFPNFWNLLVFYLYLLKFSPEINSIILVLFAILILVPIKFISFSTIPLRSWSLIICGVYAVLLLIILLQFGQLDMRLVWISLVCPLYYFIASIYLNISKRYV